MWLSFLSLQDEMEGLDLEGKAVEESTDLLKKLYSEVTLVNQALVQFNHTPNTVHEKRAWN